MPTYSYACTECANRFDAVQAFTDDALTSCPECSGRLRKLFSSVGVVFKGSGFYRTDSRAGANGSTVASEKNSEKSSESTSDKPSSTEKSTSAEKSSSASKSEGSGKPGGSGSGSGTATPAPAAASS